MFRVIGRKILGVRDLLGCNDIVYTMRTSRMHENRMECIQAMYMGIAQDAHMGSSMRRETLQFSHTCSSMDGFCYGNIQITCVSFKSLDLYSIKIFETVIFHYIRSKEP